MNLSYDYQMAKARNEKRYAILHIVCLYHRGMKKTGRRTNMAITLKAKTGRLNDPFDPFNPVDPFDPADLFGPDTPFDPVDSPLEGDKIPDGELYIFSSEESQTESYNRLSPDVRKKIEELINSDDPPGFKDAVELIRNPKRIMKECADGNIWYAESTDSIPRDNINDDDMIIVPVRTIVRMPLLIFAIYAKEYKAADMLLSMKRFSDFAGMMSVRYLSAGRWRSDAGDGYRLVKQEKYSRPDMFMLGAYINYSDNRAPLPLCHRFFEKYDTYRNPGWLDLNEGDYAPGIDENGDHRKYLAAFNTSENDYHVHAMELVRYILEADAVLYERMMNKYEYIDLLMYYSLRRNLNSSKKDLLTFRKMYEVFDECYYDDGNMTVSEKTVEDMLWEKLWNVCESNHFEFISGYIDKGSTDLGRIWKFITGKDLWFDVNKLANEKDGAPLIQLKTGFMNSNYCTVNEKGQVTGSFLEMIIRNSAGAIYAGRRGQTGNSRLDLEYLLLSCGEELLLMALKKDFIRKRDAYDLIDMARVKEKESLIPALMLKIYDEWPSADPKEIRTLSNGDMASGKGGMKII